jgi:hypothetical protein
MVARQAITIMMALEPFFELIQRRFSMSLASEK